MWAELRPGRHGPPVDISAARSLSVVRIPTIRGVIDRRILVNFRVDPDVLASMLPAPFQPQLVDGAGIAGVCLIRLTGLRPALLPGTWGLRSENAAHRIAVMLPDGSNAVYIPRRDTNSRLNVLVGGRLFPGEHHHAHFTSVETDSQFDVTMRSDDGATRLSVESRITNHLPSGSIFADVAGASSFFELGSLGFSDTSTAGRFDGLELRTNQWRVTPLDVGHVESSFFDDRSMFAEGSVEFDNALLMRNVEHEWHARDSLEAV
jgi:Uncharacterized conserved protein (COG2071)